MTQIESWENKNIDGFYTKMTQKRGFRKLCVKIRKDVIPTYSIFQHDFCVHQCFCSPTIRFVSCAFFISKQFRTCANAFTNEFTVRSYAYCAGKHWILYWIQENKTATYFLRSKLFTYDIMKNFNCNY
jgi:hypothetical protein